MTRPLQMEVPEDVRGICRRLMNAGHKAYLVGGGVRDLFMGKTPKDFDLATSAHPEVVQSLFGDQFAIPTGLQHGTVTVLSEERRPVEVTTFRTDGEYLDGRRPTSVAFSDTIEEDLSRRDFTMNAIAYDPIIERVVDPFEGLSDIMNRRVRAVGDPKARFREDGLRVMRAVRQAVQLGFSIDDPTVQAIPGAMDTFRKVSPERVREELFKILESDARRGVPILLSVGLLDEILPELTACVGVFPGNRHRCGSVFNHLVQTMHAAVVRGAPTIVRLAALLHDIGKQATEKKVEGVIRFPHHDRVGAEMIVSICDRLKMSGADRRDAVFLVVNHEFTFDPEWGPGDVKRFMNRFENGPSPRLPVGWSTILEFREYDVAGYGWGEEGATKFIRGRISLFDGDPRLPRDLAVTGNDLMAKLDMKPGPQIGGLLSRLLDEVIEVPRINTPDRLYDLARKLKDETDNRRWMK